LQPATRLAKDAVDNYGRLRNKGSAVPLREDFNTLDNPFFWSTQAGSSPPTLPVCTLWRSCPPAACFTAPGGRWTA
jgi:hypothetical protein